MKQEFVYDEIGRNHTLGGISIPSVTQIISPLSDFSKIPIEILERKTILGQEFHEAIRLHLLDDLRFDSLDSDLTKPMDAFVEFWRYKEFPMKGFMIEIPMHHKTLKYCGKPDLVTRTHIFDWKLRPFKPVTDILQLEAYKHMLPPGKRDRWTVCFDLEGNMKMHRSQHPKSWGIFRKLLERYYSELDFNNLMEDWKGLN